MPVKIVVREEVFIHGLPESLSDHFREENTFPNPKRLQLMKTFERYLDICNADAITDERDHREFMRKHRQMTSLLKKLPEKIHLWREKDGWIALPRGYLVDIRNTFEKFNIVPEITWQTVCPPLGSPIPKSKTLFDYQWYALLELMARATGVMQSPTGCIEGNTIIHLNRARKGYRLTIRDAYSRLTGGRGRPRIKDIQTFTRSLIGPQRVGLHPIKEIVFSGIRIVWELLLSNGMTLRATPDHGVLTEKGYIPLSELKPGMLVFCESYKPFSRGIKSPKRNYRQVQGIPYLSEVVSVKSIGLEDTYDIICDEPNHNFVAAGIIVHNSGKTNILLTLISELQVPTLVVVHTSELLKQTVERCKEWIEYEPGIIGGGKYKIKDITIGMIQSLAKFNINKEHPLYSRFGCVIVDECHHSPAETWAELLRSLPYRYKYGFSATAWRKDKMDFLIWRMIGPITAKVKHKEVADAGRIVWPEFRFIETNYYFDIKDDRSKWGEMITDLVSNDARNALIATQVRKSLQNPSTKALILTDRIEHANILSFMLRESNPVLFTGELKASERRQAMERIHAGASLTIATIHLLGEGIDVPGWDELFLVTPIAGGPRTLQAVGRIARPAPGKERATLYDFVDYRVEMLKTAGFSRARLYKNKGEK
jgi:hypothetical protein